MSDHESVVEAYLERIAVAIEALAAIAKHNAGTAQKA